MARGSAAGPERAFSRAVAAVGQERRRGPTRLTLLQNDGGLAAVARRSKEIPFEPVRRRRDHDVLLAQRSQVICCRDALGDGPGGVRRLWRIALPAGGRARKVGCAHQRTRSLRFFRRRSARRRAQPTLQATRLGTVQKIEYRRPRRRRMRATSRPQLPPKTGLAMALNRVSKSPAGGFSDLFKPRRHWQRTEQLPRKFRSRRSNWA